MRALLLALLLLQDDDSAKRIQALLGQAEEAAAKINSQYLRDRTRARIAEAYGTARDADGAIKIVTGVSKGYEQSIAYAGAAKALARAGDADGALRVARLGLKTFDDSDQDFKNANGIAHLVLALAEAGDIDGAIKRLGVVPDHPTGQGFATIDLAFILAKRGQLERALALLSTKGKDLDEKLSRGIEDILEETSPEILQQLAKKIGEAYSRGQAQNSIAKELLRRGKTDDAVALARDIAHPQFRVAALVSIADGIREKSPDLASTLLAQARESVAPIDSLIPRAQACRDLACALARIGKSSSVGDLAETAIQTAAKAKEPYEKNFTLTSAAVTAAAGGNLPGAMKLSGTFEDYYREECLEAIAEAQVDAGDAAGALKTIETCKSQYHRSRVLLHMAQSANKPDAVRFHLRDSFKALDKVDTQQKSLSNYEERPQHLYRLMDAFVKAGDFEMATTVAARMAKENGTWAGSFARRGIARQQAEAGEAESALKWIDKLDEPMERALSLAGAAEGLAVRSRR